MKERLFTLLCALGALALFSVMFLKREGALGARNEIPGPITAERRGGGYHAAMSWLEREGIRSVSLRERYDELAKRDDLAPTGNLLIVTLPARATFRTAEFYPLDQWVRAGNTLLVMVALSDNPDWAAFSGVYASGDVNLLTGLEFETVKSRDARLAHRARPAPPGTRTASPKSGEARDDGAVSDLSPDAEGADGGPDDDEARFRAFAEPERTYIVPNRPHAYFEGVDQLEALSDYPRQAWTVKVPYQGFVLALAHERDEGEGALWTRPLGDGRIIVSGFGSLFTNRAIGLADNAKLLANLVGVNVREGGAVVFDDVHQGLGASYDPDRFYRDRRLYLTVGILVGLWLLWVLGSTRLRLPPARRPAPREAELIRAAGSFFSRAVPAHAGARRLLDNFFRRVSQRAGLPPGEFVPWEVLERNPRIALRELEQLRHWYGEAHARRRVPLRSLHNLLLQLDKHMAAT